MKGSKIISAGFHLLLIGAMVIPASTAIPSQPDPCGVGITSARSPSSEGFVYSSFTGDGEDGLHLMTSVDGKQWKPVKNYESLFRQSQGLMRDPSICLGGDGKFHLVWTTGWWNDTLGISHSSNLIDWESNKFLYVWADYKGPGNEESDGKNWPTDLSKPAERQTKVRNCWAPEIFYDDQTQEYVIFWATTIDDPSVFPKTWDAKRWERMNQRIYYVTTKDFKRYTPRRFFYAKPDRVVIDACICKVGPRDYRMVIKDELAQRLHVCFPEKPFTTWAEMPADFWGLMSDPAFTGPGVQPDNTNAEGPSLVQVGDAWYVYCDYWCAHKNGLFVTQDFKSMTRLNDQFQAGRWVRHGTAFKVPKAVLEKLETVK
jgi:hypothetical protein